MTASESVKLSKLKAEEGDNGGGCKMKKRKKLSWVESTTLIFAFVMLWAIVSMYVIDFIVSLVR